MHKVIKDYVCFDLETTGFGKTAEIIEIGAIKVRDGTTVDKFSELVKPTNRISGVVTALTGISQNDVADARNISEVLPDFLEFIGNDSTQRTYTESYVDGIYTLTITHNGRVKVTLT